MNPAQIFQMILSAASALKGDGGDKQEKGTGSLFASLASSLGGGILGGIGQYLTEKEKRKYAEKQAAALREAMKPQVPYYETQAVPYLSNLMQKVVLGNLASRLGDEMLKKWGIDLADIRKTVGLDLPFSQTPEAAKYYQTYLPYGGFGGRIPGREFFRDKYGVML